MKMPVTLLLSVGFSVALLIGELLVGSNVAASLFFALATLVGLAGSHFVWKRSPVAAALIFVMAIKLAVLGLVLKVAFGEPVDTNLQSPVHTALVFLLGFSALVLAGWAQPRLCPVPGRSWIPSANSANAYLYWGALCFISGNVATILLGDRSGGVFGALTYFTGNKDFAIACAVFYCHARGFGLLKSILIVSLVLVPACFVNLFYNTGKQAILNAGLFLAVSILMVRGLFYKPVYAGAAVGVVLYSLVIYPYAQTVKPLREEWKELPVTELISKNFGVLQAIVFDPQEKKEFWEEQSVYKGMGRFGYFNTDSFMLDRFTFIKQTDLLVTATDDFGCSGWESIVWGLRTMPPRFLYPNKPIGDDRGPSNSLAHLTGQVQPDDTTTGISYGYLADLYNSFGFGGVLLGTAIVFGLLFWWLRLFFGDCQGGSLWMIFVIGAYHHGLVESPLPGVFQLFWVPVLMWLASLPLRLFPTDAEVEEDEPETAPSHAA